MVELPEEGNIGPSEDSLPPGQPLKGGLVNYPYLSRRGPPASEFPNLIPRKPHGLSGIGPDVVSVLIERSVVVIAKSLDNIVQVLRRLNKGRDSNLRGESLSQFLLLHGSSLNKKLKARNPPLMTRHETNIIKLSLGLPEVKGIWGGPDRPRPRNESNRDKSLTIYLKSVLLIPKEALVASSNCLNPPGSPVMNLIKLDVLSLG